MTIVLEKPPTGEVVAAPVLPPSPDLETPVVVDARLATNGSAGPDPWLESHAPITLKVTAKGQITLRKAVLAHLGIEPGDVVEVSLLPQGEVSIIRGSRGLPVSAVIGLLAGKSDVHLTIEEMNEVIAKGWAGEL